MLSRNYFMKNQELAKIFFEIADYLEIDGVSFKPYAYRKVALLLENYKEDVAEIYRNGGLKALEEIPGVGEGIAKGIEEYLKTGRIKHFEDLKNKYDKLPQVITYLGEVEQDIIENFEQFKTEPKNNVTDPNIFRRMAQWLRQQGVIHA